MRAYLLDNSTFLGVRRPLWHSEAGPVWNPFSEAQWYQAAEDMPWIVDGVSVQRGHNQPSDNDNGCATRKIRPERPPPPMHGPFDCMAGTRRLMAMQRERAAFMAKFIGDDADEPIRQVVTLGYTRG